MPPQESPARAAFAVRVGDFEGPFDLLLSLIAKHQLELTALALHQVTDDFLAHIRAQGDDWDLNEASEFLLVAATLLDLKASRLLPGDEEEDEEDLALLEARDLLFARLLQYRAYKQMAATFERRLNSEADRHPRTVGLDPEVAALMPEATIEVSPAEFAFLAVTALTPKEPPTVSVAHVHAPTVSVREQANLLVDRLRKTSVLTFRRIIADCPDRLHVVARFLACLELFREGLVTFDQAAPLGELHVRWVGAAVGTVTIDDEFDEENDE